MKLITVEKMKELEVTANAGGYSYEKMMLKAGIGLAKIVHSRYFHSGFDNLALGLVGGGNNGGDTLVALTELQKSGWISAAFLLKPEESQSALVKEFQTAGGTLFELEKDGLKVLEKELSQAYVILDGVFGTGFKAPMRPPFGEILNMTCKLRADKKIVAVDCPSGVDCSTSEVCVATLKADLTVCMEAIKEGLLSYPAFEYCGELATVELGIPEKYLKAFDSADAVIDREWVVNLLPKRTSDSHKGTFGHLIVCGGSVNYPGAPMLAARSAYRVGAGLVECAIPERIYEAVVGNNAESIFTLLEDEDGVISDNAAATLVKKLTAAQCLLLGPGIGREETTQRFIQRVLFESEGKASSLGAGFVPGVNKQNNQATRQQVPPMVIDADALRLLAKTRNWHKQLSARVVLTPHPGEMSALTGLSIDEIQNNRREVARKYAQEWQKVVVLKGALSVVASLEGNLAILPFANSALAKAGTGDVLAGMIAGLITQGASPFDAAVAGVWMHAQAAAEVLVWQNNEYSMLASDLVDSICAVFHWIKRTPR